jgi:hypothetical protein
MRRRLVGRAAVFAAIVLVLSTQAAWADDISNSLDATVDATAEVMTLSVGGVDGTTTLAVFPTGGDGKPGCNLTGSTTFSASVTSSNAAVATVSPSSVTFASCGDTKLLTVHAVAAGSASVTLSQTANTTGGSFNLAPATFTVNVAPPPNTPPNVTVTGVTHGATYEIGSVPAAGCFVDDAEDGNPFRAPSLSPIIGALAAFGLGSQTATCSYTDTGGLTTTTGSTYTIVDTGAPSITASAAPPANANGWNNTDVVVSYLCTDLGSGVNFGTSDLADDTLTATGTASGTCVDHAGNSATATYTAQIDKDAPLVTASAAPPANANGWNNTDVVVSYSCSDDGGSGVDTGASDLADDALTASGTASGTCVDNAGNSASDSYIAQIDKVAPTAFAHVSPGPNGAGWNNSDVTVSFMGDDGSGSGIDTCDPDEVLGSEGAGQSASGTCTDLAGNESAPASAIGINIDKTAPGVAWSGSIQDGDSFVFGSVPESPTCTAVDALSGPKSCDVTGYSAAVGTHTLTATAEDLADNSAASTRTYTVRAWTLTGFYAPVDRGIHNNVKAGATVPLKFEVFAGATELTNVAVINTVTQRVSCDGGPGDDIEQYATGNTTLRYDTSSGQFIFNWKTPSQKGQCYRVTMTTLDGSSISADFLLK